MLDSIRNARNGTTFLVYTIFFLVFALWQLYKIFSTGIGTDEGNFLFVVNLIKEGEIPFLDFYSRESGSLLIMIPFFNLFETSIVNLRFLVFLSHSISLVFISLILHKLVQNKSFAIALVGTVAALFSIGGVFEFYPGIFYQFYALFTCVLLFFLLLISKRPDLKYVVASGLISGLGILFYKGVQVFLILVPFILFINITDAKEYLKKTSAFFLLCLFPIAIFLFWNAWHTNVLHIYDIVLGDVIRNTLLLSLVFVAGGYFLYITNYRKIVIGGEVIVLALLSIFLLLIVMHSSKMGISALMQNMYAGLILTYGIFFILLQNAVLLVTKRFRTHVAYFFALLNLVIICFGYGSRGFFVDVPDWLHIASTALIAIHTIFLLIASYNFFNDEIKPTKQVYFFTLVPFIFFLVTALLGGYIMSTRFESFLLTIPLLIFISLKYLQPWLKIALLLLSVISIGTSYYAYQFLRNDFTFYSYTDFTSAIQFINENIATQEKSIFSLDTAILAELNLDSQFSFYTPWQFAGDAPFLCTKKHSVIYIENDACLTRENIIYELSLSSPDYILGSWRATYRIFENIEGEALLSRYEEVIRFGNIRLMELKNIDYQN